VLSAGKYVGNRPIKMRKSTWKDWTDTEALDKHKVLFATLISFKSQLILVVVAFLGCNNFV
jgi:hypothetical protein